jgi:hypothetical protein
MVAAAMVGMAQLPGVYDLAAQVPGDGGSRKLRVRSEDRVLAGLIARASFESATFRRLLTTIESTNGIVYVEAGRCSHGGVRACLQMWMKAAGGNRFLRVRVDRQREDSDLDVMASIGHELQHAIEGLSDVTVINGTMLYSFFRRYAPTDNNRFETTAAVTIGNAVRDEIHVSERSARQDPSASTLAVQALSAHHVRTTDPKIRELFDAGMSRSATFRGLVDVLDLSDVIVYAEPKMRRQALGGYLSHHIVAGGDYRYVHIAVDLRGASGRLVPLLGHELQHAIEIAQNPDARDDQSVEQLFDRLAIKFGCDGTTCSETQAAKDIEATIRAELKGAH